MALLPLSGQGVRQLAGDFGDGGEDGVGFFFVDELASAFDAAEGEVGKTGAEDFDFFGSECFFARADEE